MIGTRTGTSRTGSARLVAWLLLPLVVVGALWVGTREEAVETPGARADRLAAQVRCPTCRGQSVADSDAVAAEQVRTQIRARIDEGQSDDEIRAALVAAYGDEILLTPPRSGLAGLVWVLPVVALVLAAAGLAVAFLRWRAAGEARRATPDDLAAVERARQRQDA